MSDQTRESVTPERALSGARFALRLADVGNHPRAHLDREHLRVVLDEVDRLRDRITDMESATLRRAVR